MMIARQTLGKDKRHQRRGHTRYGTIVPPRRRLRQRIRLGRAHVRFQFRPRPNGRRRDRLHGAEATTEKRMRVSVLEFEAPNKSERSAGVCSTHMHTHAQRKRRGGRKSGGLTCMSTHLALSNEAGAKRVNVLGYVHVSQKMGRMSRRRPRFRPANAVPSMSCNRSSNAVPTNRNRRHEPMPHPTKRRTRTTKVMTKPKK